MLEKLYAQYGKLMIQQEILQAQINQVKQQIAAEMNKPPKEPEPPKE